MLVRRLREEAARQNWFGVTIDLVILIAGVFLGIQVNNWNQDRLDRHAGEDYRQRIIGDIDSNQVDLANRLAYFRDAKTFAAATLASLDRPVGENPQAFLVNAYQASQISPRKMRRFTYDEALSTGTFMKVGNPAVRERLTNFYTGMDTTEMTLQTITPYREHIRAGMPVLAQEAVREQCPEELFSTGNGPVLSKLPVKCEIELHRMEAIRDAALVRAIPTLRSDLVRLMSDLDVKITVANYFDQRAKQARGQISKPDQE